MRLIDADALNFVCVAPANDYGFGFLDGIDWAEEEVEKAPTIDGVEKVVHCKDCIMKESPKGFGGLYCRILGTAMKNNDFCSHGKRKGDVESDGMDQRKR